MRSALLLNGKDEDGLFFIRDRNNRPGDYVMCIRFKGKPTHHLLQKSPDGYWLINKKQYGECTTIQQV